MSSEKLTRPKNNFGPPIRWLREEVLGITVQFEMAKKLGESPYVFNDWECGRTEPKIGDLIKMRELCPDEPTKRRFWEWVEKIVIDNAESADKIGGTSEGKAKEGLHARPGLRVKPPAGSAKKR